VQIDLSNLNQLARGCAVLGTGGGGDVIAGLAAKQALTDFGPIELVNVDDLPDDALVMPCADMGAPTVFFEKVANGAEGERLVEKVSEIFGRSVTAILAAEIGGSNGLTPITWAARLGLPLIDGDGIGRAFPEINMISLEIAGVAPYPTVIADERGNVVVFDSIDGAWNERLARTACVEMGGACAVAVYNMDGATAKRAIVRDTMSYAIRIGQILEQAEHDPVAELVTYLGAHEIAGGKIVDVERRIEGGFVWGSMVLEGLDRDKGRTLRVEFQNEFLVVLEDGAPLVLPPDLITVLDTTTGDAISTERMRFGQRVRIVALPCAPVWRSEKGMSLAGPEAFGYEFTYTPVEELIGVG
jgi:DUF917 family protein